MEISQDLSIIIVNYNTKKLLQQCLNSIYASQSISSAKLKVDIFVVDNASSDNSIDMVKKKFPAVKLIANKENKGFAAANNRGIKVAQGRYLLLLNPDTIVLDDALVKMVGFMNTHPELGIASAQLLNKDRTIQPTGGYFPNLVRVFTWMFFLDDLPFTSHFFRSYHPPRSFYLKKKDLDWVTGAFFLLRKEVVERIGFLDEDYFMYVEEVDYCFRAKKKGFKVTYWPNAKIVHLGRKSLKNAVDALVREYQGMKLFYQKHYPEYQLPLLVFMLKLGALLRLILFGVILGRKEEQKAYAKAFRSV